MLFPHSHLQQHRQESQSPDYHRYASIGKLPRAAASGNVSGNGNGNGFVGNTHTVTVDIHQHSGPAKQQQTTSSNNNNSLHLPYSDLNGMAPAFATPPTRRRFFNHKNLRSALTGHRRTASNGGYPLDTASMLSGGKFSSHKYANVLGVGTSFVLETHP